MCGGGRVRRSAGWAVRRFVWGRMLNGWWGIRVCSCRERWPRWLGEDQGHPVSLSSSICAGVGRGEWGGVCGNWVASRVAHAAQHALAKQPSLLLSFSPCGRVGCVDSTRRRKGSRREGEGKLAGLVLPPARAPNQVSRRNAAAGHSGSRPPTGTRLHASPPPPLVNAPLAESTASCETQVPLPRTQWYRKR